MKLAVLAAVFSMSIPLAAEQAGGSRQPAGAPTSPDKIAEAYNQFLLGHRLEEKDDEARRERIAGGGAVDRVDTRRCCTHYLFAMVEQDGAFVAER